MKKNILIIHPYNEPIDGTGAVVSNLLEKLGNDKYIFVAVAPAEGYFTGRMKELGIKYYAFPFSAIKRTFNPFKLLKYFLLWPESVKKITKIINEEKIDIVVSNTSQVLFGGVAAKIAGVPHMAYIHEISFAKPRFIGKMVVKMIYKNSDKIVVVAEYIKKLIVEFEPRAIEKIEVVYNGIDTAKFIKDLKINKFRCEYSLTSNDVAFGTLGRVCDRKGQYYFIKAAKKVSDKLPNAYFFVIGEPTSEKEIKYQNELKNIIKRESIKNVVFTGLRKDIADVVAGLDAVVISSKQEAFPTVSLEAMALSKPVVTFDVGGVGEQIDNEKTGLIVQKGNIETLAGAIEKIIIDREKAQKMGNEGNIKYLKEFSIEQTVAKMDKIWQSFSSK